MSKSVSAVVLLSGGVDSSVLAHYVVRRLECAPVYALSFHYGQRHARELECARFQAQAVEVASHEVVDISFLGTMLRAGSALIEGGATVPNLRQLSSGELTQPPTYVPNRNMMLLSIAAAYAEAHGVAGVFYGAQAQDEYGYWDCTRDFLERINHILGLNRRNSVRVHAPFIEKRKAETVRLGLELGVNFARTWSCYRGGEIACGTCPTCVERLNAFREVGATDPLPYTAGA